MFGCKNIVFYSKVLDAFIIFNDAIIFNIILKYFYDFVFSIVQWVLKQVNRAKSGINQSRDRKEKKVNSRSNAG